MGINSKKNRDLKRAKGIKPKSKVVNVKEKLDVDSLIKRVFDLVEFVSYWKNKLIVDLNYITERKEHYVEKNIEDKIKICDSLITFINGLRKESEDIDTELKNLVTKVGELKTSTNELDKLTILYGLVQNLHESGAKIGETFKKFDDIKNSMLTISDDNLEAEKPASITTDLINDKVPDLSSPNTNFSNSVKDEISLLS